MCSTGTLKRLWHHNMRAQRFKRLWDSERWAKVQELSKYIHSYWKILQIREGSSWINDRVAITFSHFPASLGITDLSANAQLVKNQNLLAKVADFTPCKTTVSNKNRVFSKVISAIWESIKTQTGKNQRDFTGLILENQNQKNTCWLRSTSSTKVQLQKYAYAQLVKRSLFSLKIDQ